jgi:cell division inhibitor SepF
MAMGNPLRKTLEYLGLVDDEEYAEASQSTPSAERTAPAAAPRSNVTPLRRTPAQTQSGELNEILTVHPKKYADVQVIAEGFRGGVPIIINLSQMTEPDARRLIDFSSGLAQGLLGKIERVTPKVFLLSPQNVLVSGADRRPEPVDEDPTRVGFFTEE